jgi:hypothetical protein
MSTLEGGGNIVTDGLVLYLNAADSKSYVSGSTTWTDLSRGGNNMALVNGPTFNSSNNGSIVFDGNDDRVSRTSSIDTGQNFTVSAWIFPTLLGGTRRGVVANSMNYSSRNGWLLVAGGGGGTNGFFISIGADQAYRISGNNLLTINQWAFISGVCVGGGTNLLLYLNGVEVPSYLATLLSSGTITYTYPQLNVGYRDVGSPTSTDPYTGRIAQTSVYNRVLSDTEILQNYNATKARFRL